MITVKKNVKWIIGELAKAGAGTLEEMRPIFDKNSDHPKLLDALKQLGFYTDCYKRGYWSEPDEIIDKHQAQSMILIAEILCGKERQVSQREIELWIKHLGPYWNTPMMVAKLIDWHRAMLKEGLTDRSLESMKSFVYGDTNT